MSEVNSCIPPHFADLYVSFLTSLLEASTKELPDIYKFSAQYFENKLRERSVETKKKNSRLFQRDVPNSRGKRQFLPDFSYDSVLILHPKLSSQVTSPEKTVERLLNKEKQVVNQLNTPTVQHEERNLLESLQAFHNNEEMNRSRNQYINQYKHKKALLKKEENMRNEKGKVNGVSDTEQKEKQNGYLNKYFKVPKEQEIILDLEDIFKKENQEKSKDYKGNERNNFKILFTDPDLIDEGNNIEVNPDPIIDLVILNKARNIEEDKDPFIGEDQDLFIDEDQDPFIDLDVFDKTNNTEVNQDPFIDFDVLDKGKNTEVLQDPFTYLDVINKAGNTEVDQDPFRKCFCTFHGNHSAVPQGENKNDRHQTGEQNYLLEKQNTIPSDPRNMRTFKVTGTFEDAQYPVENEVWNQIVEFSTLLPTCLEVMGKMLNDLDERHHIPRDNSYASSDQPKVKDHFSETHCKSCKNNINDQNKFDKVFITTPSQTDFVGSLELEDKNNAVSTTAMFQYVCDVVKSAKRLLQSIAVKDCNKLQIDKITDDLFMSNGIDAGFDEFQNILKFWQYFLNKPENAPFRIDQNSRLKSLEKEHSNNQRSPEEDKNPWEFESSEKLKNYRIHKKSDPDHNVDKNFPHSSEQQTTSDTNAGIYTKIQKEELQESKKYSGKSDSAKRLLKKKGENDTNSNRPSPGKESTNLSSEEIQKLLDGLSDLKLGYSKDNLSKSLSDSVISSQLDQDEAKTAVANALLSELEEMYQTSKDNDSFFRSSPGIMQIYGNVPAPKGEENTNKSIGDLDHILKARRLKPEKLSEGKTEYENNVFFALLDPRRSISRHKKEKGKILNYNNKLPESKHIKDPPRQHNNTKARHDLPNSSETGEDIKENDKTALLVSEQIHPINTDSSSIFISSPCVQHFLKSSPEKETTKYSGDLSQKEPLQATKNYGTRKRFMRKSPAKDELQDPKVRSSFSLLDPKTSLFRKEEPFHKKLCTVDVGLTTVEDETNHSDRTKLVVHEIHQATSKLQMRILKCRRVYRETLSKAGTDWSVNDLDHNWREINVPVSGRNWLRSYFTTRLIRRYQKQVETDKIDIEVDELATPMLKHQESSYGLGSYFSQRSLFGSVRMWYFSKKMKEFQKACS